MKILLDFDKSFKLDFKDGLKEFIACEVFYKLLLHTTGLCMTWKSIIYKKLNVKPAGKI